MSDDSGSGLSRRQVIAAGTTGLIAATAAGPARGAVRGRQGAGDGTPGQIHLTWGDDPARAVTVSWASAGRADRPRVRIGQRVIAATECACSDARGGVTWTYHARVDGLRPGATYGYAVTADNDGTATDPFSATFTTAPEGRAAFRFTSFGDLGTSPAAAEDTGQAAYAAGAVETFQPLFHLYNGDLAAPGPAPGALAQAWQDFGNNVQTSAANRPWLPVPGNHALRLGHGEQGLAFFLARYTLPVNGTGRPRGPVVRVPRGHGAVRLPERGRRRLPGRGRARGRPVPPPVAPETVPAQPGPPPGEVSPAPGPPPVPPPGSTLPASAPQPAGSPGSGRGYSGGAQTRWLEATLAAARGDASLDWIVVQLHQCACSSATAGAGSDLGIRREWLPLFDTYEVDLVLSGHDHGYERSFPVRGYDAGAGADTASGATAGTRRPHPVTTVDSGVFDTSQGTVHLVLGCAGTGGAAGVGEGGPGDVTVRAPGLAAVPAGNPPHRLARVRTRPAGQPPDGRVTDAGSAPADAVEAATWSARRDTSPGYGIAVFDVSPGSEAGGQTSITVRYYHDFHGYRAARADLASPVVGEPDGDYAFFETFTLVRPRSDGRRWHPRD